MSGQTTEEQMRECLKWNTQRLAPEQDEVFSAMAPEFVPVTRGWSWQAVNESRFSPGVGQLLVATGVWLICAILLYSIFGLIDRPDSWGWEARKVTGAAVGGIILTAFVALINSEIKSHLLVKRASSRPIAERQKLATDVLCLAHTYRRTELIDQSVLRRALDSGIDESQATHAIDHALDSLLNASKEVAEDLISEEKQRNVRGYVGVAGNERLDLTGRFESLREAVNGFSTRIDHLVADKDLQAVITRRRQELNAALERRNPNQSAEAEPCK